MELNDILQHALRVGASDVHLKAGLPPILRIDGDLVPLKDAPRLQIEEVSRMALGMMTEYQQGKFKQSNEVDLAYGIPGVGRFRVNVFQQRGTIAAVLRAIPMKIATLDELMLPKAIEKLTAEQRGLVLVIGATGSGKSTTLAAMIEHINTTETCHVITIEDPIEFLMRDRRSVVNQREVGVDTMGFAQALKSALRQDPDVILVGEMRDLETIETALNAAETGHLVMSTLHTLDATETIQRIISVFPPHHQKQVRLQLASVLKGVVSQRLVPRADGRGRVPAVEVLVSTARVRELIADELRTKEIQDAIAQGNVTYGMQTFDQSLMSLLRAGHITYAEALRQATNADDFALRFSGISGTSDSKWDGFDEGAAAGQAVPPAAEAATAAAGAPRAPAPRGRAPTPPPTGTTATIPGVPIANVLRPAVAPPPASAPPGSPARRAGTGPIAAVPSARVPPPARPPAAAPPRAWTPPPAPAAPGAAAAQPSATAPAQPSASAPPAQPDGRRGPGHGAADDDFTIERF